MAQLPMDADIIVFAKAPIPGRVKTRLSPPLTSETATTVYAAMLEAVLKRVATMAGRAWLAITPDDATIEARGLTVTPQGDGDLGARLRRVSARVWAKREQSAGCQIIIGTDSPDLPIERFHEAREAAMEGRVAVVPAFDGGYCLIASPRAAPELFEAIEWGTPRVMRQTRQAATRANLPLTELEPWHDVDTLDDVFALRKRLASVTEPALTRLRESLDSAKLPLGS